MKPGRIAAWAVAAVAVPGLAACSGSSPASSSPGQSQAAAQGQTPASLTPPGPHLAFGGAALGRDSGRGGRSRECFGNAGTPGVAAGHAPPARDQA